VEHCLFPSNRDRSGELAGVSREWLTHTLMVTGLVVAGFALGVMAGWSFAAAKMLEPK